MTLEEFMKIEGLDAPEFFDLYQMELFELIETGSAEFVGEFAKITLTVNVLEDVVQA